MADENVVPGVIEFIRDGDGQLSGFQWRITMREGGQLQVELGDQLSPRVMALLAAQDGSDTLSVVGMLLDEVARRLIGSEMKVVARGREEPEGHRGPGARPGPEDGGR